MTSINVSFLISLLIIVLGYIAKKSRIIQEKDGDGIARIIFNFTLPSVAITAFSRISIDFSLLSLLLISIMYGLLMTALALFLFRNKERKERGMLSILLPSFNIGLFAYPLIEMIWGGNGLIHFAMFDMGNAFIVFGTNYVIASYYSEQISKVNFMKCVFKVFRSVPVIVYIITFSLTAFHLQFPPVILSLADILGKANMPLSLLLLGIYVNFSFDKASWKKMLQVLVVRYGIGLITGIACYMFFPGGTMFKTTLFIAFILPISLSVIPYSVEFNYNSRFVGTTNNFSILISYVLMWVMSGIVGGGT